MQDTLSNRQLLPTGIVRKQPVRSASEVEEGRWDGNGGTGDALQILGNALLNNLESLNLFSDQFRLEYLTKKRNLVKAYTPTYPTTPK